MKRCSNFYFIWQRAVRRFLVAFVCPWTWTRQVFQVLGLETCASSRGAVPKHNAFRMPSLGLPAGAWAWPIYFLLGVVIMRRGAHCNLEPIIVQPFSSLLDGICIHCLVSDESDQLTHIIIIGFLKIGRLEDWKIKWLGLGYRTTLNEILCDFINEKPIYAMGSTPIHHFTWPWLTKNTSFVRDGILLLNWNG